MGQDSDPRADGHGRPLDAGLARVLEAALARLIPSDDDGPGASEAGVATYIERSLAGEYASDLPAYRGGLAALDARADALDGSSFAELPSERQDALLHDFEQGAAGAEAQRFFELLWRHTLEGMFGDPAWGGNRDYAGWRLIGYPGPRLRWEAEQQRLDVDVPPVWEHARPPVDG